MTRAALAAAAALVALGAAAAPARAEETRRLALLVGNNHGDVARPALHYAEDDAAQLARVLIELGGFAPGDVHVLQGRGMRDVRAMLASLRADIASAHAGGRRVVLLFYYSGHSDGVAFELNGDRWLFGEVRETLKELGAEIRVSIVDSCKSGALLAEKGGTPGPSFDIRFTDDLATAGEAVLTSSAAQEMALESREIGASFFSHHLISGLRGAADSSADGRVTLGEAYRYAFTNTLLATANTLSGPQHPAYDYRLAGQGELVLTEVLARGATVALPDGFDRLLVADGQRRRIIAELTPVSAHRIAVPAGSYVVQGRRAGRAFEARFTLGQGENRVVAMAEFSHASGTISTIKGGAGGNDLDAPAIAAVAAPPVSERRHLVLLAGLGVAHGGAEALPWVGALRLGVQSSRPSSLVAGVELTRGRTSGFAETSGRLSAGYFLSSRRGRFGGEAGWRVLTGPLIQSLDTGGSFSTWTAGTGPWGKISAALTRSLRAGLVAGADAVLLRRDGKLTVAVWPSVAADVGLEF